MKRWYFFMCALVCAHIMCTAQSNTQENFLRAGQLYRQEQYQAALDIYEGIAKKGAAVWYNKGNCAFHCGNYPDALVYWLRARSQGDGPLYDMATANIEYLNSVLGKSRRLSVYDQVYAIIDRLRAYVSLLCIQCVVLFCWLSMFFLWNRRRKGTLYIILWSILIVPLVIGGVAVYGIYENNRYRVAVVMKDKQPIVVGPHADYHQLGTVESADVVMICDQKDGWYKIKSSTHIGWIADDVVQVV